MVLHPCELHDARTIVESLQGLLGDVCQRGERRCIVDSHIGEHLAVELDAGLLQTVHETGVRNAVDAGSRVDAGDPQTTDLALLVAAVALHALHRLHDLLLGVAIRTRLRSVVTASLL